MAKPWWEGLNWWQTQIDTSNKNLKEFAEYRRSGGTLDYNSFAAYKRRTGKAPVPIAKPTVETTRFVQEYGYTPELGREVGAAPFIEQKQIREAEKRKQLADAGGVTTEVDAPGGIETYTNRYGQVMQWNGVDGYVQVGFNPEQIYEEPSAEMTAYQKAQLAQQQKEYEDLYGEGGRYAAEQAREREQWQAELAAQEEYYQQQLYLQEAQIQAEKEWREWQIESERQSHIAELKANPASWLEYAAYTGETAAVQPWMLPLMSSQYSNVQAGEALPGYTTAEQSGTYENLPELVTPSAQYMARISPSARQQYAGYEKARTGQTAEDIDWRLWSQAPPGGTYTGLRRVR